MDQRGHLAASEPQPPTSRAPERREKHHEPCGNREKTGARMDEQKGEGPDAPIFVEGDERRVGDEEPVLLRKNEARRCQQEEGRPFRRHRRCENGMRGEDHDRLPAPARIQLDQREATRDREEIP